MNVLKETLELAKSAGIPEGLVAREILGVTRATLHNWKRSGYPPQREDQLQALRDTLQKHLDDGTLPMTREQLIWQGILHITECKQNK